MNAAGGSGGDRHAVVVGAGIIGTSAALWLQRDGWRVTLLDPRGAGEGCSYGNAGIISVSQVTPFAMPEVLKEVPRMLFDPLAPFALRWRYLPWLTPWLVAFAKACSGRRIEEICRAMAGLMGCALPDYETLVRMAGAEDLLVRRGALAVYTAQAAKGVGRELALKRAHGVNVEEMGEDEIRQLVPAIARDFTYGLFYPDCAHTLDPGGLVKRFAEHLVEKGGALREEAVTNFDIVDGSVSTVRTEQNRLDADLVVIAAGAWSKRLAARLGNRVPLDTERGYHVMMPEPGVEIGLPVMVGDYRFAVTPMAGGIRVAGTAEFAGLEAPANPARHAALVTRARSVFPGLSDAGHAAWMGFRPSMPDTLPVIGRAAAARNAYLAFGHGHLGLTAGAATGRAIADLAAERAPAFDVGPFSPARFD